MKHSILICFSAIREIVIMIKEKHKLPGDAAVLKLSPVINYVPF